MEIKEKEPDLTGQEFLLKKDQKHLDLLTELNEKIKKFQNLFWLKDYRKDLERQTEDIAKFIGSHYRTFIARLQYGVDQLLLAQLFAKNKDGTFKYKDAFKFLKEAEDRGLILASVNGEKVYLIDPSNLNNNTVKMIKDDLRYFFSEITVDAHALGNLGSVLSANSGNDNLIHGHLILIPLNEKRLSFISARQTQGVENACLVVNHFIDFNNDLNKDNNKKNEKTKVILKGASQGVDFITKMVGSTHGKNNTRLKNADISLEINAPHFFSKCKKIVKRLINGVSSQNKNKIINIQIINDMDKCKHPIKKTISLINNLRAKKKELSQNDGQITLTIDDNLKKTLKEYQNSHVNNNNSLHIEWLNNLKNGNVINT